MPSVIQSLGDLLSVPGVFVFGSNDYFGPRPKNPTNYLTSPGHRVHGQPLPWQDLRAAFTERGWLDMTHNRREFEVAGLHIAAAGVDDPHIARDRYDAVAGPASPAADLRLGLTHSPEPRVLDRFAADGYQLVMARHTHGGQLCLPFYGALVTNSGLDRSRAKGPSQWGANMRLHVSAGIGTSPYAPVRFCCRPEATLLTLIAAPTGGRDPQRDHRSVATFVFSGLNGVRPPLSQALFVRRVDQYRADRFRAIDRRGLIPRLSVIASRSGNQQPQHPKGQESTEHHGA